MSAAIKPGVRDDGHGEGDPGDGDPGAALPRRQGGDRLALEAHLVVPGEGEQIVHAQLMFGNGMIMLGSARDDDFGKLMTHPDETGGRETMSAYVVVSDVDAHCAQASAAGATVVMAPADQDYGGRLYICRDPEGHVWSFGSYDPWE